MLIAQSDPITESITTCVQGLGNQYHLEQHDSSTDPLKGNLSMSSPLSSECGSFSENATIHPLTRLVSEHDHRETVQVNGMQICNRANYN